MSGAWLQRSMMMKNLPTVDSVTAPFRANFDLGFTKYSIFFFLSTRTTTATTVMAITTTTMIVKAMEIPATLPVKSTSGGSTSAEELVVAIIVPSDAEVVTPVGSKPVVISSREVVCPSFAPVLGSTVKALPN